MRKSRNCSLTVETGSLQRSKSSHSTLGSSPSYAGGPPCVSKNQPSWKSENPSSSQPSRHSLLASWPMVYWCPVSCTMRPIDALPSMIIIGNSVPPPSIRCTLVSWGHWYFPKSESSHASASTVLRTAIPCPQVALSPGWYSTRTTASPYRPCSYT